MRRSDASLRAAWVDWLVGRGVPPADVAIILDIGADQVDATLGRRRHRDARPPWPFEEPDEASACRRRVLNDTAGKIRRCAKLGYKPARIAELLVLEPEAVGSFIRRTRRIRQNTGNHSEVKKPRTEAQEIEASRSLRSRVHRRAVLTPQGTTARKGWSWADRRQAARQEAADLVACQAALREGRLSTDQVIELVARVYFAEPRSAPSLPEPAIWAGPERYDRGAPKINAHQAAEIRALRRAGWSTGQLAKRFGVTRSTICNVLLDRTSYDPPSPAPVWRAPLFDPAPAREIPETQEFPQKTAIWLPGDGR
jgi:Helix-turn-helix domain of resolvase